MPELEKTDARFYHHGLILAELRNKGVSESIAGGIQSHPAGGYRYIVRCQLCGWAVGSDRPNRAAEEALLHDKKRQEKGCNS